MLNNYHFKISQNEIISLCNSQLLTENKNSFRLTETRKRRMIQVHRVTAE